MSQTVRNLVIQLDQLNQFIQEGNVLSLPNNLDYYKYVKLLPNKIKQTYNDSVISLTLKLFITPECFGSQCGRGDNKRVNVSSVSGECITPFRSTYNSAPSTNISRFVRDLSTAKQEN